MDDEGWSNSRRIATTRIAATAAALGVVLAGDARYLAWYDRNEERFGGMVGLMHHVGAIASQLEQQTEFTMTLGGAVDPYLTIDAIADALLCGTPVNLQDLSPHFRGFGG